MENDLFIWWHYPLLLCVGVIVAFVNSVAGGGSVLSLPLLIFLGLPAAEANGTNRLGVYLGMASSAFGLSRKGYLYARAALQVGAPAILGSLGGSFLAVNLSDRIFRILLAFVLAFVVVATVLRPCRNYGKPMEAAEQPVRGGPWAWVAFFLVGFYGSLVQVGVGFVMLFTFSRFTRLGLIQANAVKAVTAFAFTTVALIFFVAGGKIHWPYGLALAAGTLLGGWLGSRFQVRKGEKWVEAFILVMGISSAAKLLWDAF